MRSFRRQTRPGKSGRSLKWGPRPITRTTERTQIDIIADNLRRALVALKERDIGDIYKIQGTDIDRYVINVRRLDNARFMNMTVLASVYVFMKNENILDGETLNKAIADGAFGLNVTHRYIEDMLQVKSYFGEPPETANPTQEDQNRYNAILISFSHEYFRYTRYILDQNVDPTTEDIKQVEIVEQSILQREDDDETVNREEDWPDPIYEEEGDDYV